MLNRNEIRKFNEDGYIIKNILSQNEIDFFINSIYKNIETKKIK
ncbi:hypothetical protein XNW1_1860005 [Xenorhabdus nematophila str. Websteri]|nr:hypothetical protein XNW1_1860005 [Xenorhabdus nematophila str. Websteri]